MAPSDLVAVGKVVSAHGVRGRLKVIPYGSTLASVNAGQSVVLRKGEAVSAMTLTEVKEGPKNRLIVGLEGIDNPEEAKEHVGCEVALEAEDIPALDHREGEYYLFQLIGLKVTTEGGRSLGEIIGVLETGAHDIYVASDGENEYLIPAHEEVIREVDLGDKKMLVEEVEGLFDS